MRSRAPADPCKAPPLRESPEGMKRQSCAASSLCRWVHALAAYDARLESKHAALLAATPWWRRACMPRLGRTSASTMSACPTTRRDGLGCIFLQVRAGRATHVTSKAAPTHTTKGGTASMRTSANCRTRANESCSSEASGVPSQRCDVTLPTEPLKKITEVLRVCRQAPRLGRFALPFRVEPFQKGNFRGYTFKRPRRSNRDVSPHQQHQPCWQRVSYHSPH